MSGIAAILAREGSSPVRREDLHSMMEALAHRGPDGSHWCEVGPLLVGHLHFKTTPEELDERQPLQADSGRYCIALDGRLDNRKELLKDLDEDRIAGRQISDAQLILAAYGVWGKEAFGRFLGSFAFLLFDRLSREVMLVRDPLGDRSLFYALSKDLLLVASEESAILRHPTVSNDLDEERLSRYFAVSELRDGATFYSAIRELLPAHWLSISADRVTLRRYWEPSSTGTIHYKDDREYGEHFRQLLVSAVDCRLRSPAPAAVQMSGGLDSTSLASLVAQSPKRISSQPVKTFSWVFEELKSCDESVYMDAMVERYGLQSHRFYGDRSWPLVSPKWDCLNPNTPEDTAYRPLVEQLYGKAQQEGVRVMLTGMFGDHLFSGYEAWLTENFLGGRWIRGIREASWFLGQRQWRQLRPAFGYPLLRWNWFQRLWSGPKTPWLTSLSARHLRAASDWSPAIGKALRPVQLRNVLGLIGAHGIAAEASHASRHGLELRHPYRDRRLAEFMFKIPADQLYRRGLLKWILRVGLRSDLPKVIRERPGATSLQPLFLRGLRDREDSRVQALLFKNDRQWSRYVREDWLRERWPGRSETDPSGLVGWLCMAFELWQDRFEGEESNALIRREAV